MKQIGAILLSRGVDAMSLARALSDRPMTRFRLCSLLISRGLLEFDEASRALADQRGFPGVLGKHLDGRDREVARLLPAAVAAQHCALPIGRGRSGELIVCVRDPSSELHAHLAHVIGHKLVLVVAPATRLEELLADTYGTTASTSEPAATGTTPVNRSTTESIDVDFEVTGQIALDTFDVDAPQFKLVGLDDARVAKDHTQSGAHLLPPRADASIAAGTLPPRKGSSSAPPDTHAAVGLAAAYTQAPQPAQPAPAPPASASSIDGDDYGLAQARTATPLPTQPPKRASEQRVALPATPPTLDETCVRLERATSRDIATDLALVYLDGRFLSSLIMLVRDDVALAHRGHGASAETMAALALPLTAPSLVKLAHDSRKLASSIPAGPFQDRLSRALGQPAAPAAVPLIVATRVIGALVVGDPVHGPGDLHDAHEDLLYLAEALGLAYARLVIEAKKGPS